MDNKEKRWFRKLDLGAVGHRQTGGANMKQVAPGVRKS
jgi:hypothetical protein